MKTKLNIFALSIFTAILVTPKAQAQVTATPNDANSVVNQSGNTFTITGGTQVDKNVFHSLQKFGLNENQIADFVTNPNTKNVLGRITGGDASVINGLIKVTGSNANLFLMNPAGIIFGSGASLNVPGSFTATTANGIGFKNKWFNAFGTNNYAELIGEPTSFAFTMSQPGNIFNGGDLTVGKGENLTLLGGAVVNTGTLSSEGGNITVAAIPGKKLVRISQEGSLLSLVLPTSTENKLNPANSNLNPLSLPELLTGGNYNSATRITVENGVIKLTNSNVEIPHDAGTAIVSDKVDVSGEIGGQVNILGEKVGVIGGNINASGQNGGGSVLIGGDYKGQGTVPNSQRTFISKDSVIKADALDRGNGGKVIAWADKTTGFYGQISARGGKNSGNGGFVEVSGKEDLAFRGNVDTSAINGNLGTLFLDPVNLTISSGTGDGGVDGNNTFAGNGGLIPGTEGSVFETNTSPTTIFESELEGLSGDNLDYLQAQNINIENLSDNKLTFKSGTGTNSINFIASETSGTFSMHPSDTIETQGRALQIVGDNIQIGNISSNGGNVTLKGSTTLEGNSTINTVRTSGIGGDGNINLGEDSFDNINSDSEANLRNLTLAAGNGEVNIKGSIGNLERVNNLNISGNTINFDSNNEFETVGNMTLTALENLDLTNISSFNFKVGRDLTLQGQNVNLKDINLSQSSLNRDVKLLAPTGNINLDKVELSAERNLNLEAQSITTTLPRSNINELQAGQDLILKAQTATFSYGFTADRNLDFNVLGDLKIENTTFKAGENLNLQTLGELNSNSSSFTATDNLTLQANSISTDFSFNSLDAGQDLTVESQNDLTNRQFSFKAGGNLLLRSQSGSIALTRETLSSDNLQGDVNLEANQDITISDTQVEATRDLKLQAGKDINIERSQLSALRDTNIIAANQVEIQDDAQSPNEAGIVKAGIDLLIQGDQSINIQTFRNPDSIIESGNDLKLVSDGLITGNANFVSGGNFSTTSTGGGLGNFQQTIIPNFDSIISSQGDVNFGNYEGVALKVEAQGSITGGDITINGSNPTLTGSDPDIPLLTQGPGLVLKAGVDQLQNTPNISNQTVGGTSFTSGGQSSSANITVGNINTAVGGEGGSVTLSTTGNITTGNIRTGGDKPDITTVPGFVDLQATGNIEVKTINTSGSDGGDVNIIAGGLFKATDSFLQNDFVDGNTNVSGVGGEQVLGQIPTSIYATGVSEGGANISIKHGGRSFIIGPKFERDADGNLVFRDNLGNILPYTVDESGRVRDTDNNLFTNIEIGSPINEGDVQAFTSFTAGAITSNQENAGLVTSLRDSPLESNDPNTFSVGGGRVQVTFDPQPISDPEIVQRDFDNKKELPICTPQNQDIALNPEVTTRGASNTINSHSPNKTACRTVDDDNNILKVVPDNRLDSNLPTFLFELGKQ